MRLKDILHPFQNYDMHVWREHHKNGTWNNLVDTNKKRALKLEWRHICHTKLNINNPQTLNEKIQWLELYSDTSSWTKLTDKYEVRKYIEEQGIKFVVNKMVKKLWGD